MRHPSRAVLAAATVVLLAGTASACSSDSGSASPTTLFAPIVDVDTGIRMVLGIYQASAGTIPQDKIECIVADLDDKVTVTQLQSVVDGKQDPAVGKLFDDALVGCEVRAAG